jgi:heme/copper-type cytochrome/quinol oxidase subunit 4
LPLLLVFYLLALGCGLATVIFTGMLWAACAAFGADAALGPRPLAVFALVCFAIHLVMALRLFSEQKNRWKNATQHANTLISLLLIALPLLRFFFRNLTRTRRSTI